MAEKLALLGGPKAIRTDPGDTFTWPIVTKEIEEAVLAVLRAGEMSGTGVTKEFEKGFAKWHGARYCLGHSTGTGALHGAMFGLGVGTGDEIICPSITYWASCLPVFSLGGTVVFADIHPETLTIDPADIEHRISERTKAIVVVHYMGMPCDMDPILEIARRRGVAVIEDCSHAHGALYKGRLVGTMGEVSACSVMSGKAFACGEGGLMLTNDRAVYERALLLGQYARHDEIEDEELKQHAKLPWGGYKYRMHQLSSAMGVEQLKKFPAEMAEIQKAMNCFWDMMEGCPGMGAHRPAKGSGSTMGGWYCPGAHYRPEELGGLSVGRFCEALKAEGVLCGAGANPPLHTHPLLNEVDVYREGRPTRIANLPEGVDVRQPRGSLPVAEGIHARAMMIPSFKKHRPKIIEENVAAFRKVAGGYEDLLPGDPGEDSEETVSWGLFARR